jgi:hypothetical protein
MGYFLTRCENVNFPCRDLLHKESNSEDSFDSVFVFMKENCTVVCVLQLFAQIRFIMDFCSLTSNYTYVFSI